MTFPEMDPIELYHTMRLFNVEVVDMAVFLFINSRNISKRKHPLLIPDEVHTDVQKMLQHLEVLTRNNATPYMKEREQNYRKFLEHMLPQCTGYIQPPHSTQKECETNFFILFEHAINKRNEST